MERIYQLIKVITFVICSFGLANSILADADPAKLTDTLDSANRLFRQYHACIIDNKSNCDAARKAIEARLGEQLGTRVVDALEKAEAAGASARPNHAFAEETQNIAELRQTIPQNGPNQAVRDYLVCVTGQAIYRSNLEAAKDQCETERAALAGYLPQSFVKPVLGKADAILMAHWRRASSGGVK
ncbi:MAG: hypothetical protein WD002_15090 [Pseudomonadales bacterium]